jgi:hypothetical protein
MSTIDEESTNHKPVREVFHALAIELGMSEARFALWAAGREWRQIDEVAP